MLFRSFFFKLFLPLLQSYPQILVSIQKNDSFTNQTSLRPGLRSVSQTRRKIVEALQQWATMVSTINLVHDAFGKRSPIVHRERIYDRSGVDNVIKIFK